MFEKIATSKHVIFPDFTALNCKLYFSLRGLKELIGEEI